MARRDPETDPRAFLGAELARARKAAGFSSQDVLAAKLGFDRTVIAKAETGERPPTDDVLDAWCEACELDRELFGRLTTFARHTDGPVPSWFESWMAAEETAAMIKYWSPIIITPIFQTADYARALLLAAQTDTSDEAINALVAAKLVRAMILDRTDPPDVVALIDEHVLNRLIGSPGTYVRATTSRRGIGRTPVCLRSGSPGGYRRDGRAGRRYQPGQQRRDAGRPAYGRRAGRPYHRIKTTCAQGNGSLRADTRLRVAAC